MKLKSVMQSLSLAEKQQIVQLRLLIARAAQPDSLAWWEDDSLTPSGSFLLEKAFVFAPEEAGRTLALRAAGYRFQAAFAGEPDALHLFRLEPTGEVEYGLREVDVMKLKLPAQPIVSIEDLKQQLTGLAGSAPGYKVVSERAEHRIEIRLSDEADRSNPLRLAQIFARAMLEGQPGAPLFPYLAART